MNGDKGLEMMLTQQIPVTVIQNHLAICSCMSFLLELLEDKPINLVHVLAGEIRLSRFHPDRIRMYDYRPIAV
jgi:hypothetical protein